MGRLAATEKRQGDGMRQLWTGACALLLAACGGGESSERSAAATGEVNLRNASMEEVQKQAQAAGAPAKLQPGQWETKVEVTDIGMPGAPPAVAAQIGRTMKTAAATTVRNCVTPEEAERPQGKLFGATGDECRYRDFTMGNGRVKGTLVCQTPQRGGSMTMTTDGTFTATSFTIRNDMEMEGGAQPMTMKARVVGRRLGECPK